MHVVARQQKRKQADKFPFLPTSWASLQSIPQLFLQFLKSTSINQSQVNQFPLSPVNQSYQVNQSSHLHQPYSQREYQVPAVFLSYR